MDPTYEPYTPGSRPELFGQPSILISASVPSDRHFDPVGQSDLYAENQRYLRTARQEEIRDAIAHLCWCAFARNVNIVHGGHPAITPIILDIARRCAVPNISPAPRVVVFQSAYFASEVSWKAVWELSDWHFGARLVTPAHGGTREASLRRMRESMMTSPLIRGAVFVGGMDGVRDESTLFHQLQPSLRRFAIGSTGSAAAELLDAAPLAHSGPSADRLLLRESRSYPLVAMKILEDLGFP